MNDKIGVIAGIGVIVVVLITMYFYLGHASPLDSFELLFIGLIIIIVIGTVWIVLKRGKDIKKGLPVKDELAIKVNYKAGFYAFMGSIWISVGLIWLYIFLEESAGYTFGVIQALGSVILLTGLIWMVSYFILNRKGDV